MRILPGAFLSWACCTSVLFLNTLAIVPALSQTIARDIVITVTDGAGGGQELRFGLAPSATDTIDAALGEAERPPLPPGGVFDARFVGSEIGINIGEGLLRDYRQGDLGTTGFRTHELRYQKGAGSQITVMWNLPPTVRGLLQDIFTGTLINEVMKDSGSYVIAAPGVHSKLLMRITYGVTAVRAGDPLPQDFALEQNYPNPFNPVTTIGFGVPGLVSRSVRLAVFDLLGREVAVLVDGPKAPGHHSVLFEQSLLASGPYVYRLVAGTTVLARMMTLAK